MILPQSLSADDLNLDEATIEEMEQYLELKNSNQIMDSLVDKLVSEEIDLCSSGNSSDEEMGAILIVLKAVNIKVVNYFLTDVPLNITVNILKAALKVAEVLLTQDLSLIIDAFEKETVKQAVQSATEELFQEDLRVSPGAMTFHYLSQKDEVKEVNLQYLIVYQHIEGNKGKVEIRFYSSNVLETPSSKNSKIASILSISQIPPFILEIKGTIDKNWLGNLAWVEGPSIKATFPEKVPDFGIKPTNYWEEHFVKPELEKTKETKMIKDKILAKAPQEVKEIVNVADKIYNVWTKIKGIIENIDIFMPASLVQQPAKKTTSQKSDSEAISGNVFPNKDEFLNALKELKEWKEDIAVQQETVVESSPEAKTMSLEEIQEALDDISEKLDLISKEVTILVSAESVEQGVEVKLIETKKEVKEEIEEIELAIKEKKTLEEKSLETKPLCQKTNEAVRNSVILNEVAWMGTTISENDEWIELKNLSGLAVNLNNWQLFDKDQQIKIIFKEKIIPANGFLLLERTDDDSVKNIAADLIYVGSLANTNESLQLFNDKCQLMDEALANLDWPAGDKYSKRTMERKYNLDWQTSGPVGGSAKSENGVGFANSPTGGGGQSSPSPAPSATSSPATTTPPFIPKLLINEIQIESTSSDSDEFIEIYNPNDQAVDLSSWSIQKSYSTSTNIYKKNFEPNSVIPAKGYFLVVNASSSQALIDMGDLQHKSFSLAKNNTIYLVSNQEEIADYSDKDVNDLVGFGENVWSEASPTINSTNGKSLGRKWASTTNSHIDTDNNYNDFEIQDPSPKAQNQSPVLEPEPPSGEEPLLTVVINELAWMGTKANSSDEWIELYNNSDSTVDLNGWILSWGDNSFTFSATGTTSTVPGNSFYLLERTDSQTTDVSEDQIFVGAFNNEGEKIELRNASGTLIDLINCSSGWFKGSSSPDYISMERINSKSKGNISSNWASNNMISKNGKDSDGNKINGTPRAENSVSKSETIFSGIIDFPVFTYLGSPYKITGDLTLPENKTLIIEPGVNFRFIEYNFLIYGTLIAQASTSQEIVFEPAGPGGKWRGLNFLPPSSNSILDGVRVKRAVSNAVVTGSSIYAYNTTVTIRNSTIEDYPDRAIKLINNDSLIEQVSFIGPGFIGLEIDVGSPIIRNCEFSSNTIGIFNHGFKETDLPLVENNNFDNNERPIAIYNPNIIFKGNFSNQGNNKYNGIQFSGGYVSQDITWYKNQLPYVIGWPTGVGGTVIVNEGKTLTIEPGVTVQMANGASLEVNGTLNAKGTESENIMFTAFPQEAPWSKIAFNASSIGYFDHVLVEMGGGYYSKGQIVVNGGNIEFFNSTSSNSYDSALFFSGSISVIKNSCLKDSLYGIYVLGEICPKVENLVFENNKFKSYSQYKSCNQEMNICPEELCP